MQNLVKIHSVTSNAHDEMNDENARVAQKTITSLPLWAIFHQISDIFRGPFVVKE